MGTENGRRDGTSTLRNTHRGEIKEGPGKRKSILEEIYGIKNVEIKG